jgi:membrane-bound lytic murein transglycosylase D
MLDSIYRWNNLTGADPKIDRGDKLIVGRKPAEAVVIPPPANPTSGGDTPPVAKPTYHILQKGESLYGLSKKYDVAINDLISMNPKVFKDGMVRNGDTVFLQRPAPPKTASPQDEGYYTVQAGDDMYKICEQFKIKPSDLKIWNKLGAGVGVTKPIPAGTKLVVDADLAEALKNPKGDAPATNMTDEPIYHFVKKGETLSAVAKKYNISVENIKEFNNKEDSNVREGEKLLVGKIYYHTVEKGETLSAIAQKYKLTNEQLKALNNMKTDVVKEGEKLVVGK